MNKKNNTLYAIYDLVVSPLSYDVLGFVITAERYRRANNYDNLHLIIVPFEAGVGHINNEQFGFEHAIWRLDNVVIPIIRMLPSCQGFTYCSTRGQAHDICPRESKNIFPESYTIETPIERHHTGWSVIDAHRGDNVQYLRASDGARTYAKQWIKRHAGGKDCVAITLREARFTHSRNSNLKAWGEFAHRLAAEGYYPVVLRDIDTALELPPKEFEGITMFSEAVFNLDLRMGFYEQCHIATFVANGPAQACFYNRNVKFIYQVSGDWLAKKPTPFNRIGIDFGETPPFANKFQRWIWEEQNADTLMRYFQSLDQDIKKSHADGTFEVDLDPLSENLLPLEQLGRRYCDWAVRNYFTSAQELELAVACLDENSNYQFLEIAKLLQSANSALQTKSLDEAAEHLRTIDEKYGLTPEQCVKLGIIVDATGNFNEAAILYTRSINEGNDSPAVYFRLAMAFKNCGESRRAIEVFEIMIESGAASKQLTVELGKLYEEFEPPEVVYKFYEHWHTKGISSPEIEFQKSKLARIINFDRSTESSAAKNSG